MLRSILSRLVQVHHSGLNPFPTQVHANYGLNTRLPKQLGWRHSEGRTLAESGAERPTRWLIEAPPPPPATFSIWLNLRCCCIVSEMNLPRAAHVENPTQKSFLNELWKRRANVRQSLNLKQPRTCCFQDADEDTRKKRSIRTNYSSQRKSEGNWIITQLLLLIAFTPLPWQAADFA